MAGMKEEKVMSHIWVDTGTERKTEQACAGWSPRRQEAGNWSGDLGDFEGLGVAQSITSPTCHQRILC